MIFIKNKEIEIAEWETLLRGSPFSSPFQTNHFYNLCNSVPDLSAELFGVRDNGILKALCVAAIYTGKGLKGYLSRRAIIYGGPLLASEDNNIALFLLRELSNELKGRVIYIEVRNSFSYEIIAPDYKSTGWRLIPYVNFIINLQGKATEAILGQMKYNRRREIRLSLDEGASWHEAGSESEVVSAYKILKDLYTQKVKLPLPDVEYFLGLFRSDIGKVFIVEHNSVIIGASFCLYIKGGSVYTLYYCGEREHHKKIFPTHLSIMAAIEFGIKNQLTSLDLMGAGIMGKEYGVRKYKQEFGGELIKHGRFRKIVNWPLFIIGNAGLKVQKLFR